MCDINSCFIVIVVVMFFICCKFICVIVWCKLVIFIECFINVLLVIFIICVDNVGLCEIILVMFIRFMFGLFVVCFIFIVILGNVGSINVLLLILLINMVSNVFFVDICVLFFWGSLFYR